MRLGEALALKWSDVDLEAKDEEGSIVGEIRLRAYRLALEVYEVSLPPEHPPAQMARRGLQLALEQRSHPTTCRQ